MYTYRGVVTNIVDGDTVDIIVDLGFCTFAAHRFRLFGINAPETRSKDLEEKAKGMASKEWLSEKILNKDVTIKTHKDAKEKFGRYLVSIFLDSDPDKSINDLMVEHNLAKYKDY